MPDAVFANPRLAAVYDPLDPDRADLLAHDRIVVEELGATRVLDIGCGTGTFAIGLAARGLSVIGLDPAGASVEVARGKPGADRVHWLIGTVADLPELQVDVVTMTANVAQVFLTDTDFEQVLTAAHRALRPGGTLVFEARRPEARDWRNWTRQQTRRRVDLPEHGLVETWVQVTTVTGELVSFECPTIFHRDGQRIDSTSTLRFRSRPGIEAALTWAGFRIRDVRDAPDRPGLEWVYLADRVR